MDRAEAQEARKQFYAQAQQPNSSITVLGEFKNRHDEVWVAYRMKGVTQALVTGDELEWELGHRWFGHANLLALITMITAEENDLIKRIVEAAKK